MRQSPPDVKVAATDLLSEFVAYTSQSQHLARQEILRRAEVGAREFFVLRAIGSEAPVPFRELLSRLDFGINTENLRLGVNKLSNKSTVSQAVSKLVKQGLVLRKENKPDQRQTLVESTPEGTKLLNRVSGAETDVIKTLLSNALALTEVEYKRLADVMEVGMARMHKVHHLERVNRARIRDVLLEGKNYLPIDSVAADRFLEKWPDYKMASQSVGAFRRRACIYLREKEGIKQFVDFSANFLTEHSTHLLPPIRGCPVLYVELDQGVVARGQQFLAENKSPDNVRYVQGDITDPDSILWNEEFRRIIDLSSPIGLILGTVFHYVLDQDKAISSVKTLAGRIAAGSCFVAAHSVSITEKKGTQRAGLKKEFETLVSPTRPRTAKEFLQIFDGMELIGGLSKPIFAPDWHPEIDDGVFAPNGSPFAKEPERSGCWVGVFRNRKIIS